MEYENEALLLRIEVGYCSAREPFRRFLIMKQGNAAVFRTERTRDDPDGPDIFVSLSDAAAKAVKQILSESHLYLLKSVEQPKGINSEYSYYFYFSGGGRTAVYGGRGLEYAIGEKSCPKANYVFGILERLGKALIPEGVPAECFLPAKREPVERPVSKGRAPTVSLKREPRTEKTFVVYDMSSSGARRMIGSNARLERYAFEKRSDGSYALAVQEGFLSGKGFRDGAGNSFPLPKEWFSLSFEQFLNVLTFHYPAEKYGFGSSELAEIPGLPGFLGFKYKPSNKTDEYSSGDLKAGAEFRDELHREALAKVKQSFPQADSVVDRFSVYDYLQEHWDYPGKWYTYVAIPQGFRSRDEFVNEIVNNTLAHYRGGNK